MLARSNDKNPTEQIRSRPAVLRAIEGTIVIIFEPLEIPSIVMRREFTIDPHSHSRKKRITSALARHGAPPEQNVVNLKIHKDCSELCGVRGSVDIFSGGRPPSVMIYMRYTFSFVSLFLGCVIRLLLTVCRLSQSLAFCPTIRAYHALDSLNFRGVTVESFMQCVQQRTPPPRHELLAGVLFTTRPAGRIFNLDSLADQTWSLQFSDCVFISGRGIGLPYVPFLFSREIHSAPFTRHAIGASGERRPPRLAKTPGATRQNKF